MAKKIGGLNKGRGLEALIPSANEVPEEQEVVKETKAEKEAPAATSAADTLKITELFPNPRQPRRDFPEAGIEELAKSVKEHGVIQPLIVKPNGKYYEIIAGERRWRAAKLAGLKEVPVVIRDYGDQETLEVSIIENIQREDLKPIDEANAYKRLADEFGLTQEEIAKKVSKSRASVANSLRLLNLEASVGELLNDGIISSGHARALLAIEEPALQAAAAEKVTARGLSVRETEKLVKNLNKQPAAVPAEKDDSQLEEVYAALEEKLKSSLGTKVNIKRKRGKAGIIEIEYYSMAELERLSDILKTAGEV